MYSLDSPHPDRLRCDRCGHALPVALDVWDDPESLRMLPEDEVAAYFPGLAADLHLHGLVCPGAWFADQGRGRGDGGAEVRRAAGRGRTDPPRAPRALGWPVAGSRAV